MMSSIPSLSKFILWLFRILLEKEPLLNSDRLTCQLLRTLLTAHADVESQLSLCPAVRVLVLLWLGDTACPAWSALCAGTGAAAVFWGSLGTDARPVESPAFPPSAVAFPWMVPPGLLSNSTFPIPSQGTADPTPWLPRSGLPVAGSSARKPAALFWTRGRVDEIKIDANNPASQTSPAS